MSAPYVLSKLQARALQAWDGLSEDFGYLDFASVERRSGVPRRVVRQVVRNLARKGFLKYARGLWTEDGRPAGAGYGLTAKGCEWLEERAAA